MSKQANLLAVAAIVGLFVWSQPQLREKVVPTTVTPSVTPTESMKDAVAPITAAVKGHKDVAAVGSAYYRDVAASVSAFPERFDSIVEIETFLNNSGQLLSKLAPADNSAVRKATADAMTKILGSDETKKLDPTTVKNCFETISWAYAQAG
jgi:hypothetical protein